MTTACFTGHRKIAGNYYNNVNPSAEWLTLANYLDQVISSFMEMPFYVDRFISGLAIGVDLLAAERVHHVRSTRTDPIILVGAQPFPSQANQWPQPVRQHWSSVRNLCNEVVSVSGDPYHPSKMQVRNEWMVNNSTYVIAIWNGTQSGGTWNCVSYALSRGKSVFCISLEGVSWNGVWFDKELSR